MSAESMADVYLRYLGTSTRLEDGTTGLVWEKNGDAIAVSPADADRLRGTSAYDLWDVVSPEAKKLEDKTEADEAKAQEAAAAEALAVLQAAELAQPEPVVRLVEDAAPPVAVAPAPPAPAATPAAPAAPAQDGDTTKSQEASN